MAHFMTIPFYAFKLHLSQGNVLSIPLTDASAIRINEPFYLLAGKYAEIFQQKVLNKGNFHQILNEYVEGDYQHQTIKIGISAAKDKISYPDFELEFDYYFTKTEKGYWGVVPTLGVESFAYNFEKLSLYLEKAIKLEFARKERLQSVQSLLAAIWTTTIKLEQMEIEWRFPTLKTIESQGSDNQEALLTKIAQKINISKRVVYGRKAELDQLAKALKGTFNRNVLLVGPSGVGKTALVWEIVRQRNKRKIEGEFWESTASVMIKELTRDTGWQDNLAIVCRELGNTNDVLFIRNFMELFEVGKYEGNSVSMADYLRPFLSRGTINLVSECSEEEFARIELHSPNYLPLFQIIRLKEPKQEDLKEIIIQKVNDLAASRHIRIDPEAIRETLRLNRRFTPYAGLPGKPIRFLESILINQKSLDQKHPNKLSRAAVIEYFCEETGMPLFMVDPEVPMYPTEIKNNFNHTVFGQENAVERIVDILAGVKTALTKTGKPIASLLFVGPTGVGKTELAKVLAQFMFGNRNKLTRFDMSEYADAYSVMRLTGLSYRSDGLLTSAVRREPFCVLLFDEIEKAHPNFFDLLLQVLSEGRLTDSQGKLVNFCSTIIIMTSNIGAANLLNNRISLKKTEDQAGIRTHFQSAVQQFFRPELFNRIDEVIPFAPLSNKVIHFVVEREIGLFKKLEGIQYRRLDLNISKEVYNYLAEKGYSPQYGARQLQRTIKEQLIIPLARQLNLQDPDDQLIANIKIVEGKLNIHIEADPLGLDLLLEELEKIEYADYASELRRQLVQLKEGKVYVRLSSKLEILERQKQKMGEKFWTNQKKAKQYSYLLESKEQLEQLKAQVEQFEEQLSVSYLGLGTYDPSIQEALKQWQSNLFDFKVTLLSRLNPSINKTFLAIYGINSNEIQQLYTQIAKKKSYTYTLCTIWYRESLYKETIPFKGEESIKTLVKGRYQKKEYVLTSFESPETASASPPKEGDLLAGVVFQLQGSCVHLFLREENGLHVWKTKPENVKRFMVNVTQEVQKPPDGIHRKEFYNKTPIKRIYEDLLIEDKQAKWVLDISKRNFVPPLLDLKNKQFKTVLDKELF